MPSPNESILLFLIVLAIFGLIVGAIARLLVPGPTPMGLLGTMAAGIGGAFVGGFIGKLLFGAGYTPGWIMSIIGAVAIVALVNYGHRRSYARREIYDEPGGYGYRRRRRAIF